MCLFGYFASPAVAASVASDAVVAPGRRLAPWERLTARGQPERLRCTLRCGCTWPRPLQPGVGHFRICSCRASTAGSIWSTVKDQGNFFGTTTTNKAFHSQGTETGTEI